MLNHPPIVCLMTLQQITTIYNETPKLDADNSALAMVYGAFNASVARMPPPGYMSLEVLPSSNVTSILSEYQF